MKCPRCEQIVEEKDVTVTNKHLRKIGIYNFIHDECGAFLEPKFDPFEEE